MIVTINNVSNKDLNLDFLGRDIESPTIKTNKVNIPFRDGEIDLTEAISDIVRYNNRKITLRFEIRTVRYDWADTMLDLYARFHGKKVEIVFGDDTGYKWIGRCSVGKLDDHGFTAGINFEIDAEPFKRTVSAVYTHTYTIDGSMDLTLNNSHLRGFPKFEPSNEMFVSDDEETYTITPAQPNAYGIVMTNGANHFSFSGSGTVKVSYVGGDL